MPTIIRQIQSSRDFEAVARLRYDVYVEEIGYQYRCESGKRLLSDNLDEQSTIFAAFDGDTAVATGTIIRVDSLAPGDAWRRFYDVMSFPIPENSQVIYSKLIVRSDYRGSSVLHRLLRQAYEFLRAEGVQVGFLNCAPGLIPLYELVGCRCYTRGALHPEVGFRMPMVQLLSDSDYFESIRSPLRTIASRFPSETHLTAWFRERFSEYTRPCSIRLMAADQITDLCCEPNDLRRADAFQGLTEDQIRSAIAGSASIRIPAGEKLVREGDPVRELFIILKGSVELADPRPGNNKAVSIRVAGESFGELPLSPKACSRVEAKTLEASILLAVGADHLHHLRRRNPSIVNALAANAALCDARS